MKLTSIKILDIKHKPLIKGLSLNFSGNGNNCINTNCFIGVNGSGKSQLLESLAEIFLFLDNCYRTVNIVRNLSSPALFEISYILHYNKQDIFVDISYDNYKNKLPKFEVRDNTGNKIDVNINDLEKYLPSKVIGYTSGDNETLSNPFLSYYDVYAEFVANRAFNDSKENDYEPRFYFMDYNTNLGIAISNLVFDFDTQYDFKNNLLKVKNELNIQKIKSFRIIIQTKQSAAPKVKSPSGESGVILTKELKEWLEQLRKSATCYDYSPKDNKYVLDFLMDSASKEALAYFFNTPYNLYSALYKFEILNNLIIDKATRNNIKTQRAQRKLSTKMPAVPDKDKVMKYSELKLELTNGQIVDYLNLSDGEHQFFNVFGTLLMTRNDNALFLLDEPETHFNPKWRRLFISKINEITEGRYQDLFITSHSPFIVSDISKEFVYIFKRVSKDKLKIEYPKLETYGASFNHILQMAFDLDDSMSEDSALFIEKLLESNDPKEIEEGINKLGDSPKIMTLYRRLDLLNKK